MEVSKALESVPGVISLAAGIGCFASWFYMAGNGMRLWFHLNKQASPKNPLWPKPAEIFTERGVEIYRHARYGLIGFFVCFLLAGIFGSMVN